MKQPRPSLMGTPLVFIVACAELVGGDGGSGVHDCRLKAEKLEQVERKAPPAPAAAAPIRCDDGEAPRELPELWDGTGRSEAVRGA